MKCTLCLMLSLAFSLAFCAVNAQATKGEIKGTVLEPGGKAPISFASVAVYSAQDTVLVTYRMSDEKGVFRVPGLPVDKQLRVVVSMVGYRVFRKEFSLTPQQPVFDFGEILMDDNNLLQEVVIVAEIPPVIVRNDTLEFNASSFKTLPTALVEDLLKKLPGVSVDVSGNIAVNGKAVSKILVDGKEFFGDDPKVASRNLPADVIDKVQVMNDPDALRRDPDMQAIDIPQVINLKFKKGIKKGMFGKLYGGAGTDSRYEGGGILNMFRDTTQISVLGYSNNLNRPGFGFEDISRIGGFNRSGMNSMMIRSDGGFAINDISFGATGEGIQQSSGAGANFNTLFKNDIKLNLQYFYGGINADLDQTVNTAQFLANNTINTRRERDQSSARHSHRMGGKFEWKIDSLTNLSIRPSLSYAQGAANQLFNTNTLLNFAERLNESRNREVTDDQATTFSSAVSFERMFKKAGRRFNFFGNYDFNQTRLDQYNDAVNEFYRPERSTTFLNQLRDTDRAGKSLSNSISYNEPIIKDLSAVIRFNSDYFRDKNALNTYNAEADEAAYNNPVPELSDEVDRWGWRNYLTTGVRWKIKDVTLQPSVRFTSLDITNTFQKLPAIKQDYFYVYPALNVSWKQLYINYSVDIREPNASDLQPVLNNTNPLFIQFGNPALRPTIENNINVNFYKHDAKRSINYNMYMYGGFNKDAVTRERTIDENGVQTSRPVNTDGNWQLSGNAGFRKDYKYDNQNQFSVGASMRVSYFRTLILLNNISSFGQTVGLYPRIEGRMNLKDKVEFNQTLSLTNQLSTYEQDRFDNLNLTTRTSRSEIILRMPNKLVWESSFDYWYNSNTAPGLRDSYGRWSAAVTFLFLKNDRAQLKLSVYDILDQNLSAHRSIRENLVEDYQTVVLTRYGMLTFTYNIRNFGGKVGGAGNSIFRF